MPEPCPDSTLLSVWSDGKCSAPEAASIEEHVSACPHCAARLEGLTRDRLGALDLTALRRGSTTDATTQRLVSSIQDEVLSGSRIPVADLLPKFLSRLEPGSGDGGLGRFAGYDLEAIVGRGGMGVVFRAFDATLQRRVALKVLLHEGEPLGESGEEARFLTEARAVAALRHPHIVEIYAAGREHGWPFLVMPFHEAGTLQQWLDRGNPVSADEVIRIGLQLLSALEVTHAQGILHRDLKPSNVLLERGLDHVRLADFGLAQPVQHRPARGGRVIAGTPSYMSPEQAEGRPLDARSDLYGLGALLHHLLTGHPPAAVSTAIFTRADGTGEVAGDSSRSAAVPPRLRPLLGRLLARVAEDRWPDAATARRAFAAALPVHGRRKRVGLVVGACIVVLGLVGVLERTGVTSVVNTVLCQATGHGFHLRGRWGTYAELAGAADACRPGDIVVARFDGERVTGPVRVREIGLHLQAAPGRRPVLKTAPASEPLFLAQGPLWLEGLTLVSPSGQREASQLIVSEGATVRLWQCRLLRLPPPGEDQLIRAGRRVEPEQPLLVHKPFLTLRSGSSVHLRGCVVAGQAATAFGIRGTGAEPIRIEIEDSLVVIHRTVVLRAEPGTRFFWVARRSAVASASVIELENAQALERLEVGWEECVLDRTGGVLLRWGRGGDGSWLRRLSWTENRVVYAGTGDFAVDRRRGPLNTVTDWRSLVGLADGTHRLTARPLFGDVRVRSGRQVEGSDVDLAGLSADTGWPLSLAVDLMGDGPAYERARRQPAYRESAARPEGTVAEAGAPQRQR